LQRCKENETDLKKAKTKKMRLNGKGKMYVYVGFTLISAALKHILLFIGCVGNFNSLLLHGIGSCAKLHQINFQKHGKRTP